MGVKWVKEIVRYDPHIDGARKMADLVPVYRMRKVDFEDAEIVVPLPAEVPVAMLDDEQGNSPANEHGDFTDDEVDGAHTI